MLPGGEVSPEPQDRQASEPGSDLYFPETHTVQGPPAGPVKPELHKQALCVELPTGDREPEAHGTHAVIDVAAEMEENVPLGQSEQAAGPTPDLYLPARHCTHLPPSLVWPVAHMHTLEVVLMLYPASQVQSEN